MTNKTNGDGFQEAAGNTRTSVERQLPMGCVCTNTTSRTLRTRTTHRSSTPEHLHRRGAQGSSSITTSLLIETFRSAFRHVTHASTLAPSSSFDQISESQRADTSLVTEQYNV